MKIIPFLPNRIIKRIKFYFKTHSIKHMLVSKWKLSLWLYLCLTVITTALAEAPRWQLAPRGSISRKDWLVLLLHSRIMNKNSVFCLLLCGVLPCHYTALTDSLEDAPSPPKVVGELTCTDSSVLHCQQQDLSRLQDCFLFLLLTVNIAQIS